MPPSWPNATGPEAGGWLSVAKRTGRPPSLTREEVARAALAEGLQNMSMPTVARRLGVSHSTLYRYVHDRDDLVLAALDLAAREYSWPAADLAWRPLLLAFADSLWIFLAQRPGIAEVIQSAPGVPPAVMEFMTAYRDRLREEGLTEHDAVVALDFIVDLTVATEIAMRGLNRLFTTSRGQRSLRELYEQSWSALTNDSSLTPEAVLQGRGWLEDKLAILLDGLSSRLQSSSAALPQREVSSAAADVRVDRETVAAAGRQIARRLGAHGVTVQALAEELGTTSSAVRREVGDRDTIMVAMLDAVASEIDLPSAVDDPRTDLVEVIMATYRVLCEDAWAVTALSVDGLASPLILPVIERVYAALIALGVPDVAAVTGLLWEHVFGAVHSGAWDVEAFSARVMRSADPAEFPAVAAVADSTGRVDFRWGLEALIDGVVTRPR
jgi:AcrR family transcriptional regulator